MSEYANEILMEHEGKISSLRTDVDNLKIIVSDMSDIKGAIVKLTVLQEEQIKFSHDVSETLKTMNDELRETKLDIKETKTEIKQITDKVNDLEEQKKVDNSKNTIDIRDIQKESTLEWMKNNKTKVAVSSGVVLALFELIKFLVTNVDKLDEIKKLFGA
jgi:predicted RNase H-like nuclease (RuvC/YqgF family)